MARRTTHTINWTVILFLAGLAITTMTTLFAFYYGTNATLAKHDEQFKKLGEDFKAFGETSKQNFAEWLKLNKAEQEKAEKNAREDRDTRDKLREQFTNLFTQLSQNAVATKVQVDSITKNIDALQTKIDNISSVQQESRIIRQQSTGRR